MHGPGAHKESSTHVSWAQSTILSSGAWPMHWSSWSKTGTSGSLTRCTRSSMFFLHSSMSFSASPVQSLTWTIRSPTFTMQWGLRRFHSSTSPFANPAITMSFPSFAEPTSMPRRVPAVLSRVISYLCSVAGAAGVSCGGAPSPSALPLGRSGLGPAFTGLFGSSSIPASSTAPLFGRTGASPPPAASGAVRGVEQQQSSHPAKGELPELIEAARFQRRTACGGHMPVGPRPGLCIEGGWSA
mmetsp:Transcript_75757/g.214149  ORF Transcript_75757/g.214149 Transcript_75757/m.214149 type:complete len:242 (-) Transcript_75757:7-732(-)